MFSLLLESAARGLALSIVVWVGLKLLRIRDPQPRSRVWRAVLLSALTMPLLMPIMKLLVPGLLRAPVWIPAGETPALLRPLGSIGGAASPSSSLEWTAIALILSALITAGFLVRLLAGVVRSRRLSKASLPVNEPWTGGSDVRESSELAIPVTCGSTILLPADWREWSTFKREAVLLHEQSHVRRRDSYVHLLAGLHRAVFWFSPMSWWLERELLRLAEESCDDEAIRRLRDRISYAEILVEFAHRQSRTDLPVVAMARGNTIAPRVERALSEGTPDWSTSPMKRVLLGGTLALFIGMVAGSHLVEAARPQATQGLAAWPVQEVPDLISVQEREAFDRLGTDEEREQFIQQFWLRRDPTPGTPQNEFRSEYYRRIADANQRFTTQAGGPGWLTDRGRVLIMRGLPDELERHPEGRQYRRADGTLVVLPFEIWLYRFIEGVGTNVLVEFVDVETNGNYRLLSDPKSPAVRPNPEPVR